MNATYAAAAIRFTAHFRAMQARMMLVYDVYPFCGDGVDLVVSHNFVDASRSARSLPHVTQDVGPTCFVLERCCPSSFAWQHACRAVLVAGSMCVPGLRSGIPL
jgi:hypothetical protein